MRNEYDANESLAMSKQAAQRAVARMQQLKKLEQMAKRERSWLHRLLNK